MKHEFFLVLADYTELCDEIENAVYEAGFDDSVLTIRSGHVAIEVFDRHGTFHDTVLAAIGQAEKADLKVQKVESPVADTIATINARLTESEVDA